jgi:hypothetical protein
LRVSVDLRNLEDRPLQALRLLLVGDVLRRCEEELLDVPVLLSTLQQDSEAMTLAAASARALAVREPSIQTGSPEEAAGSIGGTFDVTVEPVGPPRTSPPPTRRVIQVGAVTTSRPVGAAPACSKLRHEPLALRLALLRFPYSSDAALSLGRLNRAEETLNRWRIKVAGWKDLPPGPDASQLIGAMREAVLATLDTAAVLKHMHRLESDLRLPSGTKFETFVDIDRVLALDLRRLVRRPRG